MLEETERLTNLYPGILESRIRSERLIPSKIKPPKKDKSFLSAPL